MNDYIFKIMPTGGVGQIGGNMTLVESKNAGLIIDCGILFPRDQNLGIRSLRPNFENFLKKNYTHLLITHAHEDHIGAVGDLLKFRPDMKVYCSRFCYELLRAKFTMNFENVVLIKKNDPIIIDDIKQVFVAILIRKSKKVIDQYRFFFRDFICT